MEIERKWLIDKLPEGLESFSYHDIEQAYLNFAPVVRIRRQDDDYILTYKSKGMMVREEYNLPLDKASYEHMKKKADGLVISKRRYVIPIEGGLKIELDVFEAPYADVRLAEIEFESEEQAKAFKAPDWFGQDVTFDGRYHNSNMSKAYSLEK